MARQDAPSAAGFSSLADLFSVHTDGGARGNPGPAGIGVVLKGPDGRIVEEVARGIGWATNNVAEYEGLIEGLRCALRHEATRLQVFMDSVLVVQQMAGAFKVKHPGLKPLHQTARDLLTEFEEVVFHAVPRERNAHADKLMNQGIDRWMDENAEFSPPAPPQSNLF